VSAIRLVLGVLWERLVRLFGRLAALVRRRSG
jgi:hypothetical protein